MTITDLLIPTYRNMLRTLLGLLGKAAPQMNILVLGFAAKTIVAIALVGILSFHLGIALLMGLPWFSLTMIAVDAIFIKDRSLRG